MANIQASVQLRLRKVGTIFSSSLLRESPKLNYLHFRSFEQKYESVEGLQLNLLNGLDFSSITSRFEFLIGELRTKLMKCGICFPGVSKRGVLTTKG